MKTGVVVGVLTGVLKGRLAAVQTGELPQLLGLSCDLLTSRCCCSFSFCSNIVAALKPSILLCCQFNSIPSLCCCVVFFSSTHPSSSLNCSFEGYFIAPQLFKIHSLKTCFFNNEMVFSKDTSACETAFLLQLNLLLHVNASVTAQQHNSIHY